MTRRFLATLLLLLCFTASAHAQEALPGEACTATNNLRFTSGPEVAGGGGHALLCQGGTWKSILSFNSTAGLTNLGNQTCATNEILKFNGTAWACAADDAGSGGDNLGNHIATTVLRSDTHNTDDLGTTAIRWKDGWFQGTVTGGTFAGSGASLTNLNASNLAAGTVPDARLTGNYSGLGTVTATSFVGSGASLTALNATNLASGTVSAARLPAYTGDVTKAAGGTALTIAANAVTTTEIAADTIVAADIAANAVGASELASNAVLTVNIANDAVTIAKLAATGTASASTFLRGDNTWAAPSGGGVSSVTTATCTLVMGTGCTATCPAGRFRTGCAVGHPTYGGAGANAMAIPSGSNACLCEGANNYYCYAMCAQ